MKYFNLGSVMNGARGKGRNLHPSNFAKEIYCRINLPPLHICKETFIPEIVLWLIDENSKTFFRKLDGQRPGRVNQLKFENLSASLGNFREKKEAASKIPLDLFRKQ